jgi:DNA primase
MIQQNSINEVMGRANIVEVVGQFVPLRKRGAAYIANCPFHNEKTPSFNVSPAKGIYKCFGCGKAGNVVTFLQEHEKLTYPEAIHWLADFYKIAVEETERTPEQQQQQQAGESLRIVNEFAANWFHDTLLHDEEGQLIGLSYFRERGFRKEIVEKFKLGYCPEQNDLFLASAIKKGHKAEILEKAGLVKNRNGIYHDFFRGRVIFPIQGMTGRVLGFGARILKKSETAPKYINTPENEIYLKSKILYGLYQSRNAIGKLDECFLVEGYTDVISLHQGGVENVVASSGTSLTEDQLRLIGQLTKNLTILYDGDAAGIKAALRGLDMALSQSINVQLVLLPDSEDPDSFIQKNGAAQFNEYVRSNKQNIINFKLNIGLKEVGNDPLKKSKLVNEIAESISRINKPEEFSLRASYTTEAAQKLQVEEAGFVNLINQHIRDRINSDNKGQVATEAPQPEIVPDEVAAVTPLLSKIDKNEEQEWQLLKVLLEYGGLEYEKDVLVARHIADIIDHDIIENALVRELFTEYFEYCNNYGTPPDLNYFLSNPSDEVRSKLASLMYEGHKFSTGWETKLGITVSYGLNNYINNVNSTLDYFELKKIRVIERSLMERLKTETDPMVVKKLQETYFSLRVTEREITKRHKPVVYESNRIMNG